MVVIAKKRKEKVKLCRREKQTWACPPTTTHTLDLSLLLHDGEFTPLPQLSCLLRFPRLELVLLFCPTFPHYCFFHANSSHRNCAHYVNPRTTAEKLPLKCITLQIHLGQSLMHIMQYTL